MSIYSKGTSAIHEEVQHTVTYGFNETSLIGKSDSENHSRNSSTGTFKGRLTTLDAFKTKFLQLTKF